MGENIVNGSDIGKNDAGPVNREGLLHGRCPCGWAVFSLSFSSADKGQFLTGIFLKQLTLF